jgi:hypothetical protein
VISVIVYGRNDAHGYNLHRRAALSLNCIAEVLSDRDDEIVFVDYNTPDELPTFVEALSDTLTDRCLERLRVFRVPAEVHQQRFAARTHLPALEPIARNAGVRRANPSNRWLLSTNTDMIFLPLAAESLSGVCSELSDAFYGLPRYELPEWLWERLPRNDPGQALAEIARLGPGLRLDEPTLSNEWIRFDAPGDFQLMLREDFLAIDGLDEEMILGYHVDSNISKRMHLYRGSIESLGERLAGYHCNHNRTPTVYHGAQKVTNDLERFFLAVERPELPAQRASWGLVDEELEEVPLRERSGGRFAAAVADAIPISGGPRVPSDAARIPFELTYDTGHVLPFVADSLAVAPPNTTVGYVGANTVLLQSLAVLVAQLGDGRSLAVAELGEVSSVDELARTADVFVVDLGIDLSLADAPPSTAGDHEPPRLPVKLARVFVALERLVDLERGRAEQGEHPRRFVLVHSWTMFWDAYVLAHLDCSHTTAHSRVRRATVRRTPIEDGDTRAALLRERRLMRWAARGNRQGGLRVRPGEAVELSDLRDYGGFGEGWSYPHERGIWTQGFRSVLTLEPIGAGDGDYILALSLDSICVRPGDLLRVGAAVNGERVTGRAFGYGDPEWNIELPASAAADRQFDLTVEIEEPSTPVALGWSDEDDRRLGILVRAAALLSANDEATQAALARERRRIAWSGRAESGRGRLHVEPDEPVDLTTLNDFSGFGGGWAYQDEAGVWTEGQRAELALELSGIGEADYVLALGLGTICVGSNSSIAVDAYLDGEHVGARELRFGDAQWHIELPPSVRDVRDVNLAFTIEDPSSPLELGWSADDRRLGILLRTLALMEVDRSVSADERIVFGEGSDADRFLGEGWSTPEGSGVWTDGERAGLRLRLPADPAADAELVLAVDPFVTPDHPALDVEVVAAHDQLARQVFRHGEAPRTLRVPLPAGLRGRAGSVLVELLVRDPARPVDLGLGGDERSLGLHLRWLMIRRSTWRAALWDAARVKAGRVRSRLG